MAVSLPERGRVLDWLGLLLLLAVVVPFVVYAVPGVVGAEGSYVVLSGSMEPSIGVGDVVIVDGADPTEIEEGDVITYLRSDAETPTTHRVIEVTERNGERAFITQGDANDDPDAAPVPASRVIGEVAVAVPYMGYVIEFVNTPAGFLALVVVPFVLLALSEVHSVLAGDGSGSTDSVEGGDESDRPGEPDPDRSANGPDGPDAPSAEAAEMPPMGPFETAAVDGDGEPGGRAAGPVDDGVNGAASASEGAGPIEGANTANTSEDAGTGENAIAFTRTDLRLSGLVLSGTTVYTGWVVSHVQTTWSFAVAFGSGFGLLLVGGMYYAAGETDPEDDLPAEERADDRHRDVDDGVRPTAPHASVRTDGEGGSGPTSPDLGIEDGTPEVDDE
ncbi:signal peptidase I [Halorubrum aquaticum]|uniref:Signal peptidase I n=1 Tax=Halorubrum aquaticum TaxID=387340 RepID=A0A1I2Z2D8_9EURY|nr:signal peptidase I [Halorubrum aquaticum]SFH31880.1 signal peptidase I [Halorubrum aquaticum]